MMDNERQMFWFRLVLHIFSNGDQHAALEEGHVTFGQDFLVDPFPLVSFVLINSLL